jgi:hypothetical protein
MPVSIYQNNVYCYKLTNRYKYPYTNSKYNILSQSYLNQTISINVVVHVHVVYVLTSMHVPLTQVMRACTHYKDWWLSLERLLGNPPHIFILCKTACCLLHYRVQPPVRMFCITCRLCTKLNLFKDFQNKFYSFSK